MVVCTLTAASNYTSQSTRRYKNIISDRSSEERLIRKKQLPGLAHRVQHYCSSIYTRTYHHVSRDALILFVEPTQILGVFCCCCFFCDVIFFFFCLHHIRNVTQGKMSLPPVALKIIISEEDNKELVTSCSHIQVQQLRRSGTYLILECYRKSDTPQASSLNSSHASLSPLLNPFKP